MASDSVVQSSFANAIAVAEGYGAAPGNLPTRSNNPGDIGNTGTSTQGYATPEAGWAALDNQVGLMFSGGPGTQYSPNMTISQVGALYATDPNWANNVAGILGVPPSTTLAQIASGQVPVTMIPRPGAGGSSTGSNGPAGSPQTYYGVNDADPAAAVPVSGSTANVTSDDIEPPYVITAGLDETPWYSDPDILQVDGATQAVPAPVTFAIYFNMDGSPLPVQVRLNASLARSSTSMRHLMHRALTRTGVQLTLWGMQPDLITGSGSTGLFMNQLGLTDFLSIADIDSEVIGFIQGGFDAELGSNGGVTLVNDQATTTEVGPDAMRIAARDAFVELLFTFKNNGIVWFRNPAYTGYTSGSDNQLGNDAWSPETGSSTFQNNARRNDVMTRGAVAMYFRNSVYYGYFKSLSWTLDATKPFQWNFTFTFQVERTVTVVPTPDLSS